MSSRAAALHCCSTSTVWQLTSSFVWRCCLFSIHTNGHTRIKPGNKNLTKRSVETVNFSFSFVFSTYYLVSVRQQIWSNAMVEHMHCASLLTSGSKLQQQLSPKSENKSTKSLFWTETFQPHCTCRRETCETGHRCLLVELKWQTKQWISSDKLKRFDNMVSMRSEVII